MSAGLARVLTDRRAGAARWGDLRTRVVSAAILAPLALAALWLGGWFWVALVTAAGIGLAHEWWTLTRRRGSVALVLAGVPYVGLGMAALLWLRADVEVGRINVLFVALLIWATDIGAYAVGRLVGGPRLAPAISPGKTWSGAAGGLCAAIAIAFCVAGGSARPLRLIAVAVALSVVAQAGDLLESAIKRALGVKDSGSLIPGHGGLFDRLDGFLTASPAAVLLALALGPGVALWR